MILIKMPRTREEIMMWKLQYSGCIGSKAWLNWYTDYYVSRRVHKSPNTIKRVQAHPGRIAHYHALAHLQSKVWISYVKENFPEYIHEEKSSLHKDTYVAGLRVLRDIGSY